MKSLVIYHSQFGNTKALAESIGDALRGFGPSTVVSLEEADLSTIPNVDLLVIGGPTQGHSTSPAMRAFLERVAPAVRTVRVATFDTRLKGPEILWGSAARSTATRLQHAGIELVVAPESFMVKGARQPKLDEGEIERAAAWATAIGTQLAEPAVPVTGA